MVQRPPVSPTHSLLSVPRATVQTQIETVQTDLRALATPDDIIVAPLDAKAPAIHAPTVMPQTAPRGDLPPHVAPTLADAAHRAGDRPVEIALNPAELGRVRMTLTPTEAGLTMSILSDRPETLDLMRRNIDDLARAFAELGYEDVDFSFGQDAQDTADTEDAPEGPTVAAEDVPDPDRTPTAPTLVPLATDTSAIDIRI